VVGVPVGAAVYTAPGRHGWCYLALSTQLIASGAGFGPMRRGLALPELSSCAPGPLSAWSVCLRQLAAFQPAAKWWILRFGFSTRQVCPSRPGRALPLTQIVSKFLPGWHRVCSRVSHVSFHAKQSPIGHFPLGFIFVPYTLFITSLLTRITHAWYALCMVKIDSDECIVREALAFLRRSVETQEAEAAISAAESRVLAAIRKSAELRRACTLALGQLEGCKPLSGTHASSLRADIKIIKSALTN
jgi:hypothetical protein